MTSAPYPFDELPLESWPDPAAPDPSVVALYAEMPLIPLHKWDATDAKGERGKSPLHNDWTKNEYPRDKAPEWAAMGHNVGIRVGSRVIVVDVDPRNIPGDGSLEEKCSRTVAKLSERFGFDLHAALRTYTGGGGRHYFLRTPEGFEGKIRNGLPEFPGVEFKAKGRQVVCPGSKHPSGPLYRPDARLQFEPLDGSPRPKLRDLIPLAPASLLDAIAKGAKREKTRTARPAAASEALPERVSLDALKHCLKQLNPLDYNGKRPGHADWFEAMQAFHSACGGSPEGLALWKEWSLRDPDYAGDAEIIEQRWNSLDPDAPGGITFATLRKHVRAAGGRPPGESAAEQFAAIGGAWSDQEMTDVGNAERFAAHHADSLRYAEETKDWRKWDGRRWKADHGLEPQALAMDTLKRMTKDAAAIEDEKSRKVALAHVLSSHERRKIHAMIELARPKLRASAVDFDRAPMLLNVANGTLDLRTHELKPHDPRDLLSKVAPTDYVPGARCAVFERFLARVLPDPDVRAYFQRLMGYALQGGQEAKCFALVVGPPDAGKSTALDTIARTLGCPGADAEEAGGAISRHYVDTATVEAFGKHDGGNRPEVAKLLGVRLVLVNEIPEDGATLEGRNVKSWTGGDLVTATPKYGHPLTFKPDGLLVFMGNTLPEIDFGDDAMWERVGLVEFGVSIPEAERDRELRSKFDRRGVLAWLVEGHREYRERGLDAPESCRLAKERRRAEADPLAEFRAAAIEPDAEGFVSSGAMWGAYQRWAAREQLPQRERLTRKKLTRALNGRSGEAAGLRPTKCGGVVGWRGARIAAAFGGAADQFEGSA